MGIFLKIAVVIFFMLGTQNRSVCKSEKVNTSSSSESVSYNFNRIKDTLGNSVNTSHSKEQRWVLGALSKKVQTNFLNKVKSSNVLVDPGYWIWGLTVMHWSDGKYHAYYSRWKYGLGFKSWLTDCEIVHAVADRPEGPYRFVNVVLDSRNEWGWESATAHNPCICVADGKICLYYISTDLKGIYTESEVDYPISKWIHSNWDVARNRQRIGVAIATNPEGPFERSLRPIVEPQEGLFNNIAVNPAVIFANGHFTMIMKGDDPKQNKVFRIQLVGHANQAIGPFVFEEKPVYDQAQTEDATIWFDKTDSLYYMVCHVIGKPELLLLNSSNSKKWTPAENPIFTKKEILLDNGEVWKPERMERPFVLTDEQGQPIMLFVAVKDKGVSGNIAIPIRRNDKAKQ